MAATDRVAPAPLCPSAQPAMANAHVLGVVEPTPEGPRVAYLNERVAATAEVLGQAAPLATGSVFRLTATCESSRCTHFDGTNCGLAQRIVARLPAVTERLPPCTIRPSCRWHRQEGGAACLRCPQVVTYDESADATMIEVARGPA
jgi:hypothetical protein